MSVAEEMWFINDSCRGKVHGSCFGDKTVEIKKHGIISA